MTTATAPVKPVDVVKQAEQVAHRADGRDISPNLVAWLEREA